MKSGRPTSKASSNFKTASTAIRSLSVITSVDTFSPARDWKTCRVKAQKAYLEQYLRSMDCQMRFELTTAVPLHRADCSDSLSYPFGGYVWASNSKELSQGIPSKMADTKECTSPSNNRRLDLLSRTFSFSKSDSIAFSKITNKNHHTKPSN